MRPANKGARPANKGARPANKDARPANKGARPANKGARPARKGRRPSTSPDNISLVPRLCVKLWYPHFKVSNNLEYSINTSQLHDAW
jgi:hypothetical protein